MKDEMLNSIIDSIEKIFFSALLDANINPFGKSEKELMQLYYLSHEILTKFSAIKQFKSGIASIYPNFYKKEGQICTKNLKIMFLNLNCF